MKIRITTLFICGLSLNAVSQTADLGNSIKKTNTFSVKTPEIDSTSKEKELSEVVITAQRTATNRFSTPEAISVLSAKNMQQLQARTTPEALTNMTGVFVQKTNHGGGSPFVRGLTGNQTLQLIDGIRLNNATFRYGPNQYFNTIDPLSIERVEVLRGSGSVQYGSDALGGTIQIFTKNPEFLNEKTWNGRLLGRIMTQGMEQTGRGELGFSNKKIAITGGLTYRNFGDLVGGDTTGKQSPSGYKELDFDVKSRFLLSKSAVLTVAHQNVKQSNVPVFHKVRLENFNLNEFDPQRRQLTYARLDYENNNPLFKKIYLITSLQNTEEGRNSRKNGSSVLRIENDKVRSLGLSLNILSQKPPSPQRGSFGYTANSGIEIYDDFVKSSRVDIDEKTNISSTKRGLYPNNSTMTSFSAFSIHNYSLNKWQFTMGGRFNGFNIQVSDETVGKSTLKPSNFVWNASILRGVTDNLNVFFSANSAFRAPNIDDLGTLGIVDFRYETPNLNLNPEKSYNFQLGFKYKKENVEKGYIQGIETAWKYAFTEGVNIETSVSYTYGQSLTKNEPMRRIPPLNGHFALNFNKKQWFSTFEIAGATKQDRLAQGDKDDNRIPKGGTPAWTIFNIYGGYSFKNLSMNMAFQNLFNEDYRTHGSGVNGVGRSVSFNISWVF